MPRCPYCKSPLITGQHLCYGCGRVISGAGGLANRVAPFQHGGTTHGRVQKGVSPRTRIRSSDIARRKKRRGKQYRNMVIVAVIAFVFLFTPAHEHVNKHLSNWLGDILITLGPYHEYPAATDYTLQRTIEIENFDSAEREFTYRLPIPIQRTTRGTWDTTFERGSYYDMALSLQSVSSMQVGAATPNIAVPVLEETFLEEGMAITLADGRTSVHWPTLGSGDERCQYTRCLIWQGTIPSQSFARLIVEYDITSFSHTWWKTTSLDSIVPGKSVGMDATNSGDYSDLNRAGWVSSTRQYIGDYPEWYDRSNNPNQEDWAIDATHALVISTADNIEDSLDPSLKNNIFAFAHASFKYVRDTVVYGEGTPFPPRNGPTCLAQGIGDCDEQSNAWMSILRTRNIPTWYEFGALTDFDHNYWEAHAWANILIPYDDAWCASEGITLETCYLEGSVDVVNNKWLLHTPTAFSEFIEPASPDGEAAGEFYRVMTINAYQYSWNEGWETLDGPHHSGGTYKVPYLSGE